MPSGINASRAPGGNRAPPRRGTCRGWTRRQALSNERFLMSVDASKLDGAGIAFTLTVGSIPASEGEWSRLKVALWKRLDRMGLIRSHHVTEWQERGAPHLHGVAFFDDRDRSDPLDHPVIVVHRAWIELTRELGTEGWAQQVVGLDPENPEGWFVYLAKHAGRGVAHYQRDRAKLPEGWQTSGRMWGKRGDWPTHAIELEVPHVALDRLRRAVHRRELAHLRDKAMRAERFWQHDEARALWRRLGRLRRARKRNDQTLSHLKGVKEWLAPEIQDRLLSWACTGVAPPRPWSVKPPGPPETSRIGGGPGGVAAHKWDHPSRRAAAAPQHVPQAPHKPESAPVSLPPSLTPQDLPPSVLALLSARATSPDAGAIVGYRLDGALTDVVVLLYRRSDFGLGRRQPPPERLWWDAYWTLVEAYGANVGRLVQGSPDFDLVDVPKMLREADQLRAGSTVWACPREAPGWWDAPDLFAELAERFPDLFPDGG